MPAPLAFDTIWNDRPPATIAVEQVAPGIGAFVLGSVPALGVVSSHLPFQSASGSSRTIFAAAGMVTKTGAGGGVFACATFCRSPEYVLVDPSALLTVI